jgi:arylsulfatase
MQIDSYTGELLDTIDDLGISENTIFIFTADNGPEALEANGTSMTVETAVHFGYPLSSAGRERSPLEHRATR